MARILSLPNHLLARITGFMERDDILTLTINTWLPNDVWREIFFRELGVGLGIPNNPPVVWSELYRRAFTRDHIYTFRDGADYKLLDDTQGLPFYVYSTDALMTNMVVESIGNNHHQSMHAILNQPGRMDVPGMRTGLWRASLNPSVCNCARPGCLGPSCSFDAWHVDLLAYDEYIQGVWQYEEVGTHVHWESRHDYSMGFFDRSQLHNEYNIEMIFGGIGGGREGLPRMVWGPSAAVGLVFEPWDGYEDSEGIRIFYYILRAGNGGDVLALRAFVEQLF